MGAPLSKLESMNLDSSDCGDEYARLHNKRMTQLIEERKDIKVLAIVSEGDTNLVFSDYNQYRWISKDIFLPVPFYIYGVTLAIIDYKTLPPPTIIVHKFPSIAEAYRKQFNVFWKMSKEPIVSKKTESYGKGRRMNRESP